MGPGGRRDLIAAFVEENPSHFNRTDLREIERWEQGVFGTFDVVRDKTDVFYLLGGYAFAVRGMGEDADLLDGYPVTSVKAILLPFDTVVTYGIAVEDLARSDNGFARQASAKALADARAERHVVRTARQFMQMAPDFLAVTEDKAGTPLPQHAGRLAGLTWEERQDTVHDALIGPLEEVMAPILRDSLDEFLVSGSPTTSLAEILNRCNRDTLVMVTDDFGIKLPRRATKAVLITTIMDTLSKVEAIVLLGSALLQGSLELNRVLDIFEAGGRVVAADDEIDALKVLPSQVFPVVVFFREAGSYVAVIPDVIREALEVADLDALRERARTLDLAYRHANLAAEFRGMVPIDELEQDRISLGLVDTTDIVFAIAERRTSIDARCDFAVVDEMPCIASERIVEHTVGHARLEPRFERYARDILMAHDGVERRPLLELARDGYSDAWRYLNDQEAFRDFARYLDAHVPEGGFDLQFGDIVLTRLNEVVSSIDPASLTTDTLMSTIGEYGLVVADEDREQFDQMLAALIDTIPNWYANGWPATHA